MTGRIRFTHAEVAKMLEVLRDLNAMPKRPIIQGLTDDLNASPDRSGDGQVPVQYSQVRCPRYSTSKSALFSNSDLMICVGAGAHLVPEPEVQAEAEG